MQITLLIAIIVALTTTNPNTGAPASTASITIVPTVAQTGVTDQAAQGTDVGSRLYVKPAEPIFVSQTPVEPIEVASLAKVPLFSFITGDPKPQYEPVLYSGKDVPIQLALQSLTPAGYSIDVPPSLADLRVDWKASSTRDEAFDSLRVSKADVGIVVNTDRKVVQVMSEKQALKVYVDPKPIQWELRTEDVRLDKALRRWAKEAGYTLRWDADRYVLIAANSTFTGTFESAVEQVLDTPGIKLSEYPLEACVYANEPPLMRITRLGDQKLECK
jgi:hypothetical protein